MKTRTRAWHRGEAIFALTALCGLHGCGSDSSDDGAAVGKGGNSGSTGAAGNLLFDASTSQSESGGINPDSACASASLETERVPLDMYLMLDTSGSMAYDGKIAALMVGVFKFLGDPQSEGLGAAAQQFPLAVDQDPEDESCESSRYATPGHAWGTLPSNELREWVLGLKAGGFTPTIPALQGAIDACRARHATQQGRKCVVILVTDGKPEGQCLPTEAEAEAPLGTLAAGAQAEGIPVFAIGFPGLPPLGQGVLNTISANGGTKAPILIESGDIGQEFTKALSDIRGVALGCEYKMPVATSGAVDPDLVDVAFTGSSSNRQRIQRKKLSSDCGDGDGWYYDNNSAPARLAMCSSTCSRIQRDPNGRVDILLGCEVNLR